VALKCENLRGILRIAVMGFQTDINMSLFVAHCRIVWDFVWVSELPRHTHDTENIFNKKQQNK